MIDPLPDWVVELNNLAKEPRAYFELPVFRRLPPFVERGGNFVNDKVRLDLWIGSIGHARSRVNAIAKAAYGLAAPGVTHNAAILRELGRTAGSFLRDQQHHDTQAVVVWIKNTAATPLAHNKDDLELVSEWTSIHPSGHANLKTFSPFPRALLKCSNAAVFKHSNEPSRLWVYAIRECWREKVPRGSQVPVDRVVASYLPSELILSLPARKARELLLERTSIHSDTLKGAMITFGVVGAVTYFGASLTIDKASGLITGLSSYQMPIRLASRKGDPMGVADAVSDWQNKRSGREV